MKHDDPSWMSLRYDPTDGAWSQPADSQVEDSHQPQRRAATNPSRPSKNCSGPRATVNRAWSLVEPEELRMFKEVVWLKQNRLSKYEFTWYLTVKVG
ncbi:hypothetical protein [Nitrospira sp. KM1]|uniref:hypothetical protein n=1 Tax=Nitrospira sp. KM1 TaxID=1936990 RepID=UPI0015675155|nr:hypothetical protein [Nitrospira sp. KM1]